MPQKTPVKKRAQRALAESGVALDLIADATGCSAGLLRREAEREGWQIGENPLARYETRLTTLAGIVFARMEAIVKTNEEEGDRIDKGAIDALSALMRAIEKLGEIMRPLMVAKEKKNDEDLAKVLDRINKRIVELAGELARKMVAEADRH